MDVKIGDNFAVYAVGDIHGEFDVLRKNIKQNEIKNAVIFLAGDIGVGFGYNNPRIPKKENKTLTEFNKFLQKRNIYIYAVSGNHDNPLFFDGNHNFTNLIFMKDYDVVEINKIKYIGIGGATSVDRKANPNFSHKGRREGVDWWSEEKVIYNEERLSEISDINVVIAHICPHFVYPPIFNTCVNKWIEYDPNLKVELMEERELMTKIYNKLSEKSFISTWVYGHYHSSNFQLYNNTKFKLLNVDEFYEIRI